MLLTDSRPNPNSLACLRAHRLGLLISAALTLALFSGVLAVRAGPGGFVFIMFPVLKFSTHQRIVLRLGMDLCQSTLNS